MSAKRPTCERVALRRLLAGQAVDELAAQSKRGSKSNAWNLPHDMLIRLLVDDIEQRTVDSSIETIPGLAEEMDLRGVSERSITRWLASARDYYRTLLGAHNSRMRRLGRKALAGADMDQIRALGPRAVMTELIAQLEEGEPGSKDPETLEAIVKALGTAARAEATWAKADLDKLKAEELRSKVQQIRDRVASEPKDAYSTEEVDGFLLEAVQAMFRRDDGEAES